MDKIIVQCCCGPCATACVERLLAEGARPVLFFANSNIDTPGEWERRLEALQTVGRVYGLDVAVEPYARDDWERCVVTPENALLPEGGARCAACFAYNFAKTAAYARRTGIDAWTTTLSVSPHKSRALLFEAGHAVALATHTRFLDYDFSLGGGFKRSVELSRLHALYRQRYCGCAIVHP